MAVSLVLIMVLTALTQEFSAMATLFVSTPFQLLLSILLAFTLGSYFSLFYVSLFYTISSLIVESLLFLLPFMLFAFIFNAIHCLEKKSLFFVLLIFGAITCSNFISLHIAYFIGNFFLPFLSQPSFDLANIATSKVFPLLHFFSPLPLATALSMVLAVITGISCSYLKKESFFRKKMEKIVSLLFLSTTLFLKKIFIPLLPLYVFGFCIKLNYDATLWALFRSYGTLLLIGQLTTWSYLSFFYYLASGKNFHQAIALIKKMVPAGLTGFSTMSSAAAIPITLECTQNNSKHPETAQLLVPIASNSHLLSDNITIVLASLMLLVFFGKEVPAYQNFIFFAFSYCVTMLCCVGIPGGTILVILPLLQSFLNFSPEMASAIATFYILQDSFGTMANVMGNGAFTLALGPVLHSIQSGPQELTTS